MSQGVWPVHVRSVVAVGGVISCSPTSHWRTTAHTRADDDVGAATSYSSTGTHAVARSCTSLAKLIPCCLFSSCRSESAFCSFVICSCCWPMSTCCSSILLSSISCMFATTSASFDVSLRASLIIAGTSFTTNRNSSLITSTYERLCCARLKTVH